MNSCVYTGHLTHRRTTPVAHHFRYPIGIFYLDLDELEALSRQLRLFSLNRGNVVSFHDTDHMDGRPGDTKAKLVAFVRTHDIDLSGGRIFLLTQCRMLHYVFNPVSFYYCYGRDAALRCVVAEVNNTFGERHLYVLAAHNQIPAAANRLYYQERKVMHVSPFVSMQAVYEFRFAPVGDRLSVFMAETEHGQHFFDAHLFGTRMELTNRNLAWLVARFPLLTVKIIAAIHWEALWLYVKGVPFYHQPAASAEQLAQLRTIDHLTKEVAR